jgi:hypothetical protein
VAAVKAEYEAFNESLEGQLLDAALSSREAFAKLPEELKDRAMHLSYRLHMARREVCNERKEAN